MNIQESCKCPACSDSLVFDIEDWVLRCPSCGAACAIEKYESDLWKKKQPPRDAEPAKEDMTCPCCGVALSPGVLAFTITCPCCGGFIQDKTRGKADSAAACKDGGKPDLVIPFAHGREDFFRGFRKLCEKHPSIPDDFVRNLPPESILPVYLPAFLYEAQAAGDISIKERDEDGNPVTGTLAGHFSLYLKGLPEFLSDLPLKNPAREDQPGSLCLEPWKISRAQPCRRAWFCGLRDSFGHTAPPEIPESQKSPDYESIKNRILYLCRRLLTPEERITVVSQYLAITPRSIRYVLFPVWLCSISYHGKTYLSVMNASTGKTTIAAPRSLLKGAAIAFGFSFYSAGLLSLANLPFIAPLLSRHFEPLRVLLFFFLYVPLVILLIAICVKSYQFCCRRLFKGLPAVLMTSGACFGAGLLIIDVSAAIALPAHRSLLISWAAGISVVCTLAFLLFSGRENCDSCELNDTPSRSILYPDRTDFDKSYIDLRQSRARAEFQCRGKTKKLPDPLDPLRKSASR